MDEQGGGCDSGIGMRTRRHSYKMPCEQQQKKKRVMKRMQSSGTVKAGGPPGNRESTGRGLGRPPTERQVWRSRIQAWVNNIPTSTSVDEVKEDSALEPSDTTTEEWMEVTVENETMLIANSSMENMVMSVPSDERSTLIDISQSRMTESPKAVNARANEEKLVFDRTRRTIQHSSSRQS